MSRALGDFEFKQNYSLNAENQIVTADPDIITHKIDGEEEFVVLACDGESSIGVLLSVDSLGIWDCLSSQQVIDFTRRAVANGDSLAKICEDMMHKCLARESDTGGIGCDNMTVVVVALLGGRTPEEWQAWVKQRVDDKGELFISVWTTIDVYSRLQHARVCSRRVQHLNPYPSSRSQWSHCRLPRDPWRWRVGEHCADARSRQHHVPER